MYIKYLTIVCCYLISIIGIAQTGKNKISFYYRGENGESLVVDMEKPHNFMNLFGWPLVDSLTKEPYTGIATKWAYPYNSPDDAQYTAVDSMCLNKGIVVGYRKEYGGSFMKGSKAEGIGFTDPSLEYNISTSNLLAPFNSKFTNISSVFFYVNLKDVLVHCSIDFKKNIKVEVKIARYSTNNKKSKVSKKISKQRIKLNDQEELERYIKSFKDVISEEIVERLRSMGVFDNNPIKEPIIKGNCGY